MPSRKIFYHYQFIYFVIEIFFLLSVSFCCCCSWHKLCQLLHQEQDGHYPEHDGLPVRQVYPLHHGLRDGGAGEARGQVSDSAADCQGPALRAAALPPPGHLCWRLSGQQVSTYRFLRSNSREANNFSRFCRPIPLRLSATSSFWFMMWNRLKILMRYCIGQYFTAFSFSVGIIPFFMKKSNHMKCLLKNQALMGSRGAGGEYFASS